MTASQPLVLDDMKDYGKAMVLSVMVAILFFGVLELSARLVFTSNTIFNINIDAFKSYHPTHRTQLKSNYQQGDISINSLGLLGPEFSIPVPKSGVRILTIGDSVSFTPPRRNYSAVVEAHMNAFFTHQPIEVLVGAVPGYSSYDALDWYDEFLYQLNPDIALIALGWNDIGQFHPFGLQYKNSGLYRERTLLSRLMEMFYFMRIPYLITGYIERSKSVDTAPLTIEESRKLKHFIPTHFRKNLLSLVRKLQLNNCRVYLLTLAGLVTYSPTVEELKKMHFPRNMDKKLQIYQHIYRTYNNVIEYVARQTATPMIDLRTLIQSPEKRKIYTDTMHLNPSGAEAYGAYIAERLRPFVAQILKRKSLSSNTD